MTKGSSDVPDTRALYRKYRSKSLAEVVGQGHITDVLQRALKQGKIAHAYLFTGPRGVGKTSIARIMAHEINGLPYDEETQHPDIIEIDAASNRRIDDIRDLRDKVRIAPVAAKYKVYIIDEVHMLTGESFNAFLKTLEEPPEHVVFILATTDAHKLPVTITSRTQRYGFRSITQEDACAHLRSIATAEGITIDDDALALIARHGDGSFRDSISLLDQLSSLSDKAIPITRAMVEQVLGIPSEDTVTALLAAYEAHDAQGIIATLQLLGQDGIAAPIVASQLIQAIRERIGGSPQLITLLDDLIEVARSPRPDIKLLTVLLRQTATTPVKYAASAVSAPELKTLEKEALKPKPKEANIRKTVVAAPVPQKEQQTDTTKGKEEVKEQKPTTRPQSDRRAFDWDTYVTHMREHHVALSSILAKCKAESNEGTLTIYTGTAFWKKKLDGTKYQPVLHDALRELGMGELAIETIPTTMPPKDSQAAAIAAIMGGGEEIELGDG